MTTKTEVLMMAYELGEMATGDEQRDLKARMSYYDCAAEDAADQQTNRAENIRALAEQVGLTEEQTCSAYAYGQTGYDLDKAIRNALAIVSDA